MDSNTVIIMTIIIYAAATAAAGRVRGLLFLSAVSWSSAIPTAVGVTPTEPTDAVRTPPFAGRGPWPPCPDGPSWSPSPNHRPRSPWPVRPGMDQHPSSPPSVNIWIAGTAGAQLISCRFRRFVIAQQPPLFVVGAQRLTKERWGD